MNWVYALFNVLQLLMGKNSQNGGKRKSPFTFSHHVECECPVLTRMYPVSGPSKMNSSPNEKGTTMPFIELQWGMVNETSQLVEKYTPSNNGTWCFDLRNTLSM